MLEQNLFDIVYFVYYFFVLVMFVNDFKIVKGSIFGK